MPEMGQSNCMILRSGLLPFVSASGRPIGADRNREIRGCNAAKAEVG
jgi:hypothetical protein